MVKTQYIYVGGTVSIFTILSIIVFMGGTVITDGNKSCATECVSYVNVSIPAYKVIRFNSSFELIKTDPQGIPIDTYIWNTSKKRWDLFKGQQLKGKVKFKIVGHKTPLQTVKWWSDELNIPDPVWKAVEFKLVYPCLKNITEQQPYKCKTEDYNFTEYYYEYEWTYNPKNDSYYNKSIEKYFVVVKQREVCSYKTVTVGCSETDSQHLQYGDLLIDTKKELGVYCGYVNDSWIQCDDCNYDGNCDGILTDGESGIERITPETIYYLGYRQANIQNKFSTKNIKEGKLK